MTLINKIIAVLTIVATFTVNANREKVPTNELETIIQKGFPTQPEQLKKITADFLASYNLEHNITSLVFYSYGLLRLANYYKSVNNYVAASEYAKLGFFYLDESVEGKNKNWRLQYLRSRVDAYLPRELGRCVIALKDTKMLIDNKQKISVEIIESIKSMRYRALQTCQRSEEAEELRLELKKSTDIEKRSFAAVTAEPEKWRPIEVREIIIPLMSGE